jgi:acyl carrier protein
MSPDMKAAETIMQNTETIYALLRDALVELFELDPARITPEANLYTDLEIDSIDAIDLIDHIKRVTGSKLAADDFRSVRTVSDVVRAVVAQQERMA